MSKKQMILCIITGGLLWFVVKNTTGIGGALPAMTCYGVAFLFPHLLSTTRDFVHAVRSL